MLRKIFQPVFALAIGILAMIVAAWAFMTAITAGSASMPVGGLIAGAVFLVFGLAVGLFWRGGSFAGGIWLASPFFLITIFSLLFSGFATTFLTHDLPILTTSLLAAVIGCYLGQRLTSGRVTKPTTEI